MTDNCVFMVLSANGSKGNGDQTDSFFCPVIGCKYNLYFSSPAKSFKTKKLLKQHYLKVHSAKKYKCDNCSKGFSLESALKSHCVTCGVTYSCYCGAKYTSPEAFLTHTKRKEHNIGLKYSTITKLLKERQWLAKSEVSRVFIKQEIPENGKKSAQTQTVTDVQTLSDSSTQTTFENIECMIRCNDPKLSSTTSSPIRRLCAQTQTDPLGGKAKINTDPMFLDSETQTNFDFLDIYTQTAESERLFCDLEFTNIQTQTCSSSLFNDICIKSENDKS